MDGRWLYDRHLFGIQGEPLSVLTMLGSGGLNETTCDPVDKATRISLIYTSLTSNLLTLIGCLVPG